MNYFFTCFTINLYATISYFSKILLSYRIFILLFGLIYCLLEIISFILVGQRLNICLSDSQWHERWLITCCSRLIVNIGIRVWHKWRRNTKITKISWVIIISCSSIIRAWIIIRILTILNPITSYIISIQQRLIFRWLKIWLRCRGLIWRLEIRCVIKFIFRFFICVQIIQTIIIVINLVARWCEWSLGFGWPL